jgi:hypothetical protein
MINDKAVRQCFDLEPHGFSERSGNWGGLAGRWVFAPVSCADSRAANYVPQPGDTIVTDCHAGRSSGYVSRPWIVALVCGLVTAGGDYLWWQYRECERVCPVYGRPGGCWTSCGRLFAGPSGFGAGDDPPPPAPLLEAAERAIALLRQMARQS